MNLKMAGVLVAAAAALVACGGGEQKAAPATPESTTAAGPTKTQQEIDSEIGITCTALVHKKEPGATITDYEINALNPAAPWKARLVHGSYKTATTMRTFLCEARIDGDNIDVKLL